MRTNDKSNDDDGGENDLFL